MQHGRGYEHRQEVNRLERELVHDLLIRVHRKMRSALFGACAKRQHDERRCLQPLERFGPRQAPQIGALRLCPDAR